MFCLQINGTTLLKISSKLNRKRSVWSQRRVFLLIGLTSKVCGVAVAVLMMSTVVFILNIPVWVFSHYLIWTVTWCSPRRQSVCLLRDLQTDLLPPQVIEISDYRAQLYDYLKNRMTAIAPNLTVMVGELVGARLISHAGRFCAAEREQGGQWWCGQNVVFLNLMTVLSHYLFWAHIL